MGKSFRGPVVAESVNLRHVLRGDDASDLETLARRPPRERHGEVHDQALEARSFDLPHQLASVGRAEEPGARLKVSEHARCGLTSKVRCEIYSDGLAGRAERRTPHPRRTVWKFVIGGPRPGGGTGRGPHAVPRVDSVRTSFASRRKDDQN